MTKDLDNQEILSIAKKTLAKYILCDNCLGRAFAKIESGLTNKKRGQLIRTYLKDTKKTKVKNCWLCSGLCNEIPYFADLISNSLNGYDFETFLIGSKVDEEISDKQQELLDFSKSDYSEPIKTELNREIGKILESKLKQEVDFKNPTIMAVIDTAFDNVELQISSLYIYGRYKKFKRGIPQTRWFCNICRGKGCRRCDYKGKLYETSIEELLAKNFLEITQGNDHSFHGCGREDVDARMLGNGRPFVLEIINPKKRKLNLTKIENDINVKNEGIIEITNLRFSNKNEIKRLKDAEFRKTYRIVLKGKKPIKKEKLKKVAQSLRGIKIGQFTPSRVAHRRANMVREKYIYDCQIESVDGPMATLTLETDSGTYIKELVSGDNGRTKPNISEMIGVPCEVTELDVLEIKGE